MREVLTRRGVAGLEEREGRRIVELREGMGGLMRGGAIDVGDAVVELEWGVRGE